MLDAESLEPGSASYDLAWICAQLGQIDECREWLAKSGEPGKLISADMMAGAPRLGERA
jgi:hypothetical protein